MNAKAGALRHYSWLMRLLALTYTAVGALFFTAPQQLLEVMNRSIRLVQIMAPGWAPSLGTEIPMPAERFYVVLTTSMMAMLVVVALYSSFYPKVKGFFLVHLVSKTVSVAGFLHFFFVFKQFPYLAGALIDGWVIFMVLVFYLRTLGGAGAKTLHA